MTISDERKKKYDFSTPYTVSGIQALVKKGNEGTIKTAADLKGKKWVSVWARTTKSGCARTFRAWTSVPMMMTRRNTGDLRVGRIDAILVDRLAALDLVKKTNNTLAVAGDAFSRQESGVAVRKGNEDLVKAIDAAIADMQKTAA